LILEKTKFLKEQAMVILFSIRDNNGKLLEEDKELFRLRRARDLAEFKKSLESSKEGQNGQNGMEAGPDSEEE
jgi:hypothetical protein